MTPLRKVRAARWLLASGLAFGLVCFDASAWALQAPRPPDQAPARAAPDLALTLGRALVQRFYAVQVEAVWAAFTPDMQEAWQNLAAFRAYREMGVREYGAEARVLGERTFQEDGLQYYVRTAVFDRHPEQAWAVVFAFDAEGRVALFTIVPARSEDDPLRSFDPARGAA